MALELDEDLSGRPEFSTLEQQRLHKHELHAIFRERFASQPTDYWITRLEEQDLLCGPVRPLAEALADAQTAENGMLLEFEHPVAGVVRTVSAPVHLTRTPAALHRRPPLLGEHTEEVLTALGYDREQLQQLRKHRIIAAPEFSAGADMKAAGDASGTDYWLGSSPNGFGGIALRRTLDVPVVARVNGYALGGGMEMLLGCDIAIAAESAQFGLTEPRVGRMPLGGGIPQLVRQIPRRHAMGLLLTGRRIDGREALALGLVNEVVGADELDEAVDRWLEAILACAPTSLRAIKQIVQRTALLDVREVLNVKLPALLEALDSEDSREGVRAFLEKRPPAWRGG
jgi:crotonobetainyl-CoA hydratase